MTTNVVKSNPPLGYQPTDETHRMYSGQIGPVQIARHHVAERRHVRLHIWPLPERSGEDLVATDRYRAHRAALSTDASRPSAVLAGGSSTIRNRSARSAGL